MSWSTPELRVRLALWNRFKPSGKIFYWPFQGGTSFVDLLWGFFLSCVCYAFVCVCLFLPCGHLLGTSWPLGSRLWCITVSLSLSYWYPGSGVVLDCIHSWSLHPTNWNGTQLKTIMLLHRRTIKIFNQACLLQKHGCVKQQRDKFLISLKGKFETNCRTWLNLVYKYNIMFHFRLTVASK